MANTTEMVFIIDKSVKKVVEVLIFISKTGKIPLPKPIDAIPIITQPIPRKIEFSKN